MNENKNQHLISSVEDLTEGDRVISEIEGIEVCLINSDGEYFAVANYCPHQGGPVCEGSMGGYLTTDENRDLVYKDEESILCCPWHAWEFDIETGEHVTNKKHRIPTYDVEVENGDIFVTV